MVVACPRRGGVRVLGLEGERGETDTNNGRRNAGVRIMPGEKGSYRSVYSAIWDDPEFQGFDLLTRQTFLYLRTSKDCNFPCIYVFYPSILSEYFHGVKQVTLDRVWDTLYDTQWIRYERPILWIVKGLKNEPNYSEKSDQQRTGIVNILKTLPKLNIINEFAEYYGLEYRVSFDPQIPSPIPYTIPMGIPMGIQGTGTGTGTGTGEGTVKTVVPRPGNGRFTIPTIDEVSEYCAARRNNVDPVKFHAFYSSNGWRVGKNPMKKWKAAIVTWEKN
jgi:hypothetical protein